MTTASRCACALVVVVAGCSEASHNDSADTADGGDTGATDDSAETASDVAADAPDVDLPPFTVVAREVQRDGRWAASEAVTADLADGRIEVRLTGDGGVVEGCRVEIVVRVPGATSWLSNGFQSWSQSGVLALARQRPTEEDVAQALAATGDVEVIRGGAELSWFYTFVAGPSQAGVVVGALDGARWKPSITTWAEGDDVHFVLRSGGAGERVTIAGAGARPIETWFIAEGPLSVALPAFAAALPSRQDGVAPRPEAGWNSWYDLWSDVDEAAVRANAALAKDILAPLVPPGTPLRIVIDDGWQRAWGDWQENDKFPSGLAALVSDLRTDGLEVGLWYAPLLVHEDSEVARAHPDWLVPEARFDHLVEGRMRILDPFVPEAAEHLRATAAGLIAKGLSLLKIDFLFAGTFERAGHTGMEAYVAALKAIRAGAGDALLLAVGNPIIPALPYVDLWRVGGDIAVEQLEPSLPFIVNQLRSIGARWPLCSRTLCDADPVLFRAKDAPGVGLASWVAALTGGAMFLSDDLRALSLERRERIAATWTPGVIGRGLSGRPALPLDLVPAEPPVTLVSALADHLGQTLTQVVPRRWLLADGRTVVFDVDRASAARDQRAVPAGTTWQIQLEGEPDPSPDVAFFDLDLFDTSLPLMAELKRRGRAIVCYFSAGSWEEWRPDAGLFDAAAKGKTLDGFADERWLDIRRADVRTLLSQRFDRALAKDCDAVDPDNVQGFLEDTGFALTAADQLDFNRWLADEAHRRGMAVGLKNDLPQVADLVSAYDFAVNESCLQFDECALLRPFIAADKAVFHIEYRDEGASAASVCADPARAGFSTVIKTSTAEVDAALEACSP